MTSPARGLSVTGLSHSYGRDPVLREVSLAVPAGSSTALMGPSGCGKSTLLLAVAGILVPTAGGVVVGGEPVPTGSADTRAAFRRSRMGIVFQFGELISELTLEENVALAAELCGASRRRARGQAQEALGRVGLGDVRGEKPGAVSGGQAQRAAIARAVVHGPDLVLADEPTGSLDGANGEAVMDLLLRMVGEDGATLLVVTHDETVARRCEHTVRMRDGVIDG